LSQAIESPREIPALLASAVASQVNAISSTSLNEFKYMPLV
jgi:hypothetical protein